MADQYRLETQGFRNIVRDGDIIGFGVEIRINYYRGVALAIIGDLQLEVDGELFTGTQLRFELRGKEYTLEQMGQEETERWEYGEKALLIGLRRGGLAPGTHTVRVTQTIRPAYAPGDGFVESTERTMTLSGETTPLPDGITLGVSLYSYQREYFTGKMSLEECVAEVAAIGATGVQLLPEQMMPGYPNPSDEWVQWWFTLLERHNVQPTVLDTFVDVSVGGHRDMSFDEGVSKLVEQLRLAKRLGFWGVRPTTGPVSDAAPDLIRAALPEAERLNIKIVPEIHAPVRLGGALTSSYIDIIKETGTEHLGFTLDLGVFCRQLPPALIAQAIRDGVPEEVASYVATAYVDEVPSEEILSTVQRMTDNPRAHFLALISGVFGPRANSPEDLADILPYTYNIHSKFYDVTDAGEEATIPYEELLQTLVDQGWRGSLDSEYEGQRLIMDAFEVDSPEQVRRQHLLIRQLFATVSSRREQVTAQ